MKAKNVFRLLLLLVLAAGIALAVLYRDRLDVAAVEAWLRDTGPVAPLVFMAVYAVATVFFFPGSVLTLAGGALFGPVLGTLYNLTGATLGATLAFLVSRYIASGWARRKAGRRVTQLVNGVESEGWRFVAFTRLVPLFPFNLLNYALGLTRIRLGHYILATWVFMLPGAIAYTYLGYAGREAVAGDEAMIDKGLLALALLAVAVFLPRFVGRLRRGPTVEVGRLWQWMKEGRVLCILDVRTPEEFEGELGHIMAARNIPLSELKRRVDELDGWLERPVAIVCRTDHRSAKAAALLTRAGFADVHVVQGGMTDWNKAGLPVERSAA
jgi:uncharacterized membrane protein YdjX (TVP38/TMEM64 family)/rhodanese-related sulfurtransferase